jgi:predicted pyridoxine 5'-phosphate oxidase superfamily flavin-nucleotide-binding protein
MRREVKTVDELRAIVGHPNSYVANLRINGTARILADADYFDAMTVEGKRPILALEIDVEEVFFHCAKAFLRSDAWNPGSWNPTAVPSVAQIAKALTKTDVSEDELDKYYSEDNLRKVLY